MNHDALAVFSRQPQTIPLYEAAEALITGMFPDVSVKAGKTQVSYSNRYGFAYLWPPTRKIKGRPGIYIVLTFGLSHQVQHPRIIEAVEPYPGRWTHHVLISSPDELDGQISDWLRQAYDFSMTKGRGRL